MLATQIKKFIPHVLEPRQSEKKHLGGEALTERGSEVAAEIRLDALCGCVLFVIFQSCPYNALLHLGQQLALMSGITLWINNPNVLYELGIRHAANSGPALVLFNNRTRLPSAVIIRFASRRVIMLFCPFWVLENTAISISCPGSLAIRHLPHPRAST